jgi:aldehyde dehydrogenase (NAD+)
MVTYHESIFVGGNYTAPSTDKRFTVISPWTEQPVASVPEGARADIDRAVEAAADAQRRTPWGIAVPEERPAVMKRLADTYERRKDEIAEAMTLEMGCPVSQVFAMHVDPAVRVMHFYADLAATYPFSQRREGTRTTIVNRIPAGVTAAIVPWNGPALLAMLKVAPALAAGCSVILKPSPEAPLSAYVLADIAREAELPAGALNVVTADREVSEYLVTHPRVRRVSFTGSTSVGRHVAELCAHDLKRVSLELGGKSPAIFLDDADLETTVPMLRFASFANAGQVCTARTRLLVPRRRYTEISEAIAAMVDDIIIGDPSDPATEMGPLVSERQQQRVLGYLRKGIEQGAKTLTHRTQADVPPTGWFVAPTVLGEVTNDMTVAREEIFGPVVCVLAYDSVEQAISIANDSDFGLSGSVFTGDVDAGLAVAELVESGTFGINAFGNDVAAPFGGVKGSGIGREMGVEGLEEFLEYRSILLPA